MSNGLSVSGAVSRSYSEGGRKWGRPYEQSKQKRASTWYQQHFIVDSEHRGAEEDEDKEVNRVHIWKGL